MNMKRLSRYEIESHLGTGAFSDVYKAVDIVLNRIVALKVLKPMLVADNEAFARFKREAQVAANLFHPYIATVLDMGEAEGRYFIAMRYVDGKSLDKVIVEKGALPWGKALKIVEQIGSALQFAHEKGLVHRDVKPQNIIFSPSEGAVLTDFGLVKALNSSGMSSTTGMIGTPAYIAPEIWEGKEATPATDQYALACVVTEMFTGEVLFDGTTPAIMRKHLLEPPSLPEKLPSGVSEGLRSCLCRALSKKAQERYESVTAFAAGLKEPEAVTSCHAHVAEAEHFTGADDKEEMMLPTSSTSRQRTATLEDESIPGWLKSSWLDALHDEEEKKAPKQDSENLVGIEWVEVPAGEFLSGEGKKSQYIQEAYLVGKYPVTNEQYRRFLAANPAYPVPSFWDETKRICPPGKEKHPAVYVSWHDAQAFCKWAGCRLPTEAEWEKAARGTDGRVFPWGQKWKDGCYCNSIEAKIGDTTPVDQYPRGVSIYGVWDMSGNVWEWTSSLHDRFVDCYVLRGGAWDLNQDRLRLWYRNWCPPNGGYYYFGFRCARSISEKETQ